MCNENNEVNSGVRCKVNGDLLLEKDVMLNEPSVAFQRLAHLLQTRQVRLMSAEDSLQFAPKKSSKKNKENRSGNVKAKSELKANSVTDCEGCIDDLPKILLKKNWKGYVMRHIVEDVEDDI